VSNDSLQAELVDLLLENAKHTTYQMLPPCVKDQDNRFGRLIGTQRQDEKRYDWLKSNMPSLTGRVIDIGANLGYFSFRTLQDYQVNIVAYEPYKPHAKAISIIRKLCDFEAKQMKVVDQGIGLREIEALPQADLLILLNVIQHAGEDYDQDLVDNIQNWRSYAVNYLTKLRSKADKLFFQMGYTWLGYAGKLCKDENIIDFTASLLVDAGWQIKSCGIIKDFSEPFTYQNYDIALTTHNKVFLPKQNRNFFFKVKRKVLRYPKNQAMSYRFAQRPLWFCEK